MDSDLSLLSEPVQVSYLQYSESSVATLKVPALLHATPSSCCKLDISLEMFSQPQEMMISYLGGWLIRRTKICSECVTTLTDSNAVDTNHLFIDAKSYYTDSAIGLLR